MLDCEYRQHTKASLETHRIVLKNLFWFAKHRQLTAIGTPELRQFLLYLRNGHEEPGGRWGNRLCNKPLRPRTVKDNYCQLRTFFNWLVTKVCFLRLR